MKNVGFIYFGVIILGILIALNFITGRHNITWLIIGMVISLIGSFNLIARIISKKQRSQIKLKETDERLKQIEQTSKALCYDLCFIILNLGIVITVFFYSPEVVFALVFVLILQTLVFQIAKLVYSKII